MIARQPAVLHQHFLKKKIGVLEPSTALCVTETIPMRDAVRQLKLTKKGCMVVTKGTGEMSGIVSERDVLMKLALEKESEWDKPVSEFMTPKPRALRASASIARVLYEMATGKFRHIPIVGSKEGDPIRMISVRDFLDFIHKSVTEKISKGNVPEIVDPGSFDLFFRGQIHILKPGAPEVIRDILPIRDALDRMRRVPIGAIVVLNEDQKISGLFSERDYLMRVALESEVELSAPIQSVASSKVTTALSSSSVSLVFDLMSEGNFRHMPIVDADEDLTGILSLRNFVEYLSASILDELENYG